VFIVEEFENVEISGNVVINSLLLFFFNLRASSLSTLSGSNSRLWYLFFG